MTKFKRRLLEWNWWNELISIPIGLLAFYLYPYLAVKLEDEPAIWSVGILQKLVFAFVVISIANGIAGLLLKLVFPNIFGYKNGEFTEAFSRLTDFQKCVLLLASFSIYFFGFIAAVNSL